MSHQHLDTSLILNAIDNVKDDLLSANHNQTQLLKSLLKQEFGRVFAELEKIKVPKHVTFIIAGQSIRIPGLRNFQGEDMSYTVPRDHQDEPYVLDPIVASDSEGPVLIETTERLESSNPDVVSDTGSAFHFGTFGGATINRIVVYQGTDFIVSSVVFNITPGAITSRDVAPTLMTLLELPPAPSEGRASGMRFTRSPLTSGTTPRCARCPPRDPPSPRTRGSGAPSRPAGSAARRRHSPGA